MLSIKTKELFYTNFSNPRFDPCVDEYKDDLLNLIDIIKRIGKPLEGSVFFNNLETNLSPDNLSESFLRKRRTLALLAKSNSKFVEIGFNAGFSALLLLTANPNLNLLSIDICMHDYTIPCFEYLKSRFGSRIDFVNGNSLVALPLALAVDNDFDVFIIDGGHGVDVAEADLCNVISRAPKNSLILFDDSDWPALRVMLNFYVLSGKLNPIIDTEGYIHNTNQMFFRVI